MAATADFRQNDVTHFTAKVTKISFQNFFYIYIMP